MRPPTHHPPDELLMDYAAGAASEAESLIVAAHLALCPLCRHEVQTCEAIGGALMVEGLPEATISDECLLKTLARIEAGSPALGRPSVGCGPAAEKSAEPCDRDPALPGPLAAWLQQPLEALQWTRLKDGAEQVTLPWCCRGWGAATLIRLEPGASLPKHRHRGPELTLVLAGGVRDGDELYAKGDVCVCTDEEMGAHAPEALADGPCLLLSVNLSRSQIEADARQTHPPIW